MTQEIAANGKTLIAIYDMDKTVTRRATYNGFLVHMAKNRAPWRFLLAPFLPFGLAMYGLRIWSRERLKEFSQSLFLGRKVSREEISAYLKSHAEMVVGTNIYPEFNALLREEKAAGYRHIIATASYKLYVDAIAERLKFDDVIATDLATDDAGQILARIDGGNCYDTAKLEKVQAWMAEQGLLRGDCYIRAYSDHVSDAPLLDFADEAFATNPHPPLAKLAKEKGWQIIDWR